MTKTRLIGAVVALLLVGCGKAEPTENDTLNGNKDGVTEAELCEDIEQVVDSIRNKLGSCTPNYKNQEPLAFSRSACDDQLGSLCDEVGLQQARQYVDCLQAVAACNPAQQTVFDDAIDDCLDTFQNSDASGECIELVVGD